MFAGSGQFGEKFKKYRGFFTSYSDPEVVKQYLNHTELQNDFISQLARDQTTKLNAVKKNIDALPNKLTQKGREILKNGDMNQFSQVYNMVTDKTQALNNLTKNLDEILPGISEEVGALVHAFKKRMIGIEAKVRREQIDVLYEVKEQTRKDENAHLNRIIQNFY